MAYNKLYRNFIILQEDENSHSGSEEKPLSGYAKIEAKSDKCKISFYAQNLKKDEKYSIVLICYRKDVKQIVDLGFLNVSEMGKGEAVKEYYVNNIAGLNFSYEKISGAAICKHKNEGLSFLMYGFMNNENIKEDWKKCKIVKCADKADHDIEKIIKESKKEYKKNHDEDKCDHDDKHDYHDKHDHDDDKHDHHDKHDHDDDKHDHHDKHDHDDDKYDHHDKHDHNDDKHDYHDKCDDDDKHDHHDKCDDDEKHDYHDKHDHDDDKHDHHDKCDDDDDKHKHHDKCDEDHDDDDDYYDEEDKKEEHHKHNEDYECDVNCRRGEDDATTAQKFDEYEMLINKSKENQEVDPYDFQLRGAIGDFFNNITKGFEEVKGKFKEIKYCKWYKIRINGIDDMCNTSDYNKYTVAYYPMLNYYPYIKKYGYFFIGYKCDTNGNLKYIVYGIPGKKDKDEQPYVGKTGFVTWISSDDGKNGCWLMFYDFKNSNIVVPMK